MPRSNSLSLNTSSQSQIFSESDVSNVEPPLEDIHEYAKRIGIDPVQESHLLDLAKEGLTQKLPPNWRPCQDALKNWYYYNTETKCSQWEHPLDAVYREKVAKIKCDIAMNRLQNFNPGAATGDLRSRPGGKNLPPLKVRPALSPLYLPVPPLIPDPFANQQVQNVNGFSPTPVNRLFGPTTNSLLRAQTGPPHPQQRQPFSILGDTKNADAISNTSPVTSRGQGQGQPVPASSSGPRQLQPMSMQPLGRKQTGGLTLSGSGASFLKSNSTEEVDGDGLSSTSTPKKETGSNMKIVQLFKQQDGGDNSGSATESSGDDHDANNKNADANASSSEMSLKEPEPVIRRPGSALPGSRRILSGPKFSEPQPFQSTLNKTIQNSLARVAQLNSKASKAQAASSSPWSLNPDSMTDEEKDLWSNFGQSSSTSAPEGSRATKSKQSVKFKLDENPELHFEVSGSEKQSEDNSEEEGASSSDDAFNVGEGEVDGEKGNEAANGSGQITRVDKTVPPARPSTAKGSLSQENGIKITDFKNFGTASNLENFGKEKLDKEKQMKNQLEQSLAELRTENEKLIRSTRISLEKSRKSQYEKLKREIEESVEAEVEKIRAENKTKLEARKKELSSDFEKSLEGILEVKSMNKETLLKQKREEFMKEIEKEIHAEMKELKETMRKEQRKQIQQMKDYHGTFIAKLKREFSAEDEKIRKEHAASISETVAALNRDREQLISSLREQQEAELEQLRQEFEQKKQHYATEIGHLQGQDNGDVHVPKSASVVTPAPLAAKKFSDLESKEAELRDVKNKYKQLEDKYLRMKQDLDVVIHAAATATAAGANGIKSSTKLVHATAPGHNDELSNSNVATSNDATDDDEHHLHRSSSVHDSVISNSTIAVENGDGRKVISINDIIAGSDDRLNKALSALEHLRNQIIEIKAEQQLKLDAPGVGEGKKSQKVGTSRVKTNSRGGGGVADGKHSKNVFPTKVHRHNETLPTSKKSVTRLRASASISDIHKLKLDDNNNPNHAPNGTSRSSREVVQTAKEFIQAQKHRLVMSSLNSLNSSPSKSYLYSTFPRLRRIDDVLVRDGLYSDATATTNDESSGIGTMYTNPLFVDHNEREGEPHRSVTPPPATATLQRTQVSKDIDTILVSLKQLDKQMKYMWSVVDQKHVQRVHNTSAFSPGDSHFQPTLLTPLIHPVSPSAVEHLEAILRNRSVTTPGLPNYYDEVSRRYRELNFVNGSTNGTGISASSSEQMLNISPSLLEKTKDLREWLENF